MIIYWLIAGVLARQDTTAPPVIEGYGTLHPSINAGPHLTKKAKLQKPIRFGRFHETGTIKTTMQ